MLRAGSRSSASAGGFTLLEVMIALALIAIGVLIGLTMVTTSSMQNEVSKEQAVGYRACQDVMEALMTMDKATLLAQMAVSPATFTVPPLNPSSPPTGTYMITDITTEVNPTATSTELVQIQVRLMYKRVNVTLTSLRHLP